MHQEQQLLYLKKQQIITRQRSQHPELRAYICGYDVWLSVCGEWFELSGVNVKDCQCDTLFAGDEERVEGGRGWSGGGLGWGRQGCGGRAWDELEDLQVELRTGFWL